MKKAVVDIYTEKKKKKILKEGVVSVSWENGLTVHNIPYYIDKNKKAHVGVPGIACDEVKEDGSIKTVIRETVEFTNKELWTEIKQEIEPWAIEEFEKEQTAAKEKK